MKFEQPMPSLPSSVSNINEEMAEEITREVLLRIMKHRDVIEENIQALDEILTSNHIGMTEPLVDAEGFPRNDIDVYQVRHARHQIICLQNDYKNVTKEIESKMKLYHERIRESGESSMDIDSQDSSTEDTRQIPIVKVNLVSEGSPAFHAGLKVDDEILAFGSIREDNFTSVNDIGALVQSNAGRTVYVKVKRGSAIVKLALIPGPWSGRGLLGCNIIPIPVEANSSIDR